MRALLIEARAGASNATVDVAWDASVRSQFRPSHLELTGNRNQNWEREHLFDSMDIRLSICPDKISLTIFLGPYQLSQALSIASYIRTWSIAYELPLKRTLFFAFVLCPMIPLGKRSFDNLQNSFLFERRAFLLILRRLLFFVLFLCLKIHGRKSQSIKSR